MSSPSWFPQRAIALVCAALFALTVAVPDARAQATRYADAAPLLLGVAWYPEQWPEAQWERDLTLMQAAHVRVVRIGEFAWSRMEPRQGQYDFGWLDRAIAAAARHHIVVVLGTPTAAPPAWLTQAYPDTLRVGQDGVRDEHGNRQQFSFASARYRRFAHAIAEQMAQRYGRNPHVVGWQLDNEYAQASFDPEAKAQFHAWLQRKYGSIEALNRRWATAYWSQTYNDFAQIPVHEDGQNPALLLEWKRFVSATWTDYSRNQIDAIRPHADPRQFITTNTMGWFAGFDAYTVHDVLDIAAWDDYVAGERYDWVDNAARHDLTRGYKQRNYWVMETQPGFVNWRATNVALRKGQVRAMAWQAVAHGADAVSYWQWRAAPNGQEEYHGTLVGADGEPVPVYAEIQQVGAEFAKAGAALAGTTPHAEVALINDFDSRWALGFQKHSADFDPVVQMKSFYRPLRQQAQVVDVVSALAPLDGYKLVVAPSLNVLSEAQAQRLKAYVEHGGHLVLGPRSAMKNADNGLQPQRQPGPLGELLGGRVQQFYALDKPIPVAGAAGEGSAKIWAEQLQARAAQTEVPLRYGQANGWLDGAPAVLTRRVGKGRISYVGAWLDDATLDRLTGDWLRDAQVRVPLADVPQDVEVGVRSDGRRRVLVLINHGSDTQQVRLPAPMRSLLGAGAASDVVQLAPEDVAVLDDRR
ncbi:beta-galactosidase [Xanthomonas translucens]|uniref:beta-galactosidase n=1 Tax=Xanthomonas campestris pv. translucens TaxID=343 RepID=UPI00071E68A7|nr:beta-galactosidase [Xanthomonas translucens]KTF39348.1 beta-galactosidase [Xanthomonas translucens pv. translucens]MCS3358819.1 beta-galactosidase [Xanthomonas translucens pv. translucens]MCS3372988.1 beta-galactosidase [Xanthomonas translucens pv. translucens]MCT8273690.1 beta-galactosidase [Xanthomonas translucens pv. translucens]MCT8277145.1 beta-galactosidase [Xanthomonas translucens pv. translucens]